MAKRQSKLDPKDIVQDIIFFILTVAGTFGYLMLILLIFSFMFVRAVEFLNLDFDHMLLYAGAGAGIEPISMVLIPKRGNTSEGVRVLDLSKGNETNKALSDLGLIVSDLVKNYMGSQSDDDYDEAEYIEPEFTTKGEIEDDE